MTDSPLDPNDFVIARKRKKYRFAKFANSPLCYEFDEWKARPVDVLELGAGTGLFSVELAARHPEKQYLAVDVKGDRLQKGAYEAEARGLQNVLFLRARVDQLAEIIDEKSINDIWVTFPDPYPKKRSAGRRLTHPHYLKLYRQLLSHGGALCLKHDAPLFFMWSLEQLVTEAWHVQELSFDLHNAPLSEKYKIMTSYEERWVGEDRAIYFVKAEPVDSPASG